MAPRWPIALLVFLLALAPGPEGLAPGTGGQTAEAGPALKGGGPRGLSAHGARRRPHLGPGRGGYRARPGHGRPRAGTVRRRPSYGHGSYRPRPPYWGPPGARPPGWRPPHARPPGWRTPHARPPGWRPPHWRPPHWRPPHYRPPHRRWGRWYWYPPLGWYFTGFLGGVTFAYVVDIPRERDCEELRGEGGTYLLCDGVLYRPVAYQGSRVWQIVSAPEAEGEPTAPQRTEPREAPLTPPASLPPEARSPTAGATGGAGGTGGTGARIGPDGFRWAD